MTESVAVKDEAPSFITESDIQSIKLSAQKSSVNAKCSKIKRIASSNDQVALTSKVAKVNKSK